MAVQVSKKYCLGDFSLDPEKRGLVRGDKQLHLANRPFQVLLYLIEQRERLVTRAELLELFWQGKEVYDETLTKCVGAIRKALDDRLDHPRFIETRYAEGYRYIGPLEEQYIKNETAIVEVERTRGFKILVEEEEIQIPARTEVPPLPLHTPAETLSLNAPKSVRRMMALALALCALVLTASALLVLRSRASRAVEADASQPAPLPFGSIVVLPLKNLSDDPAQEYFSDGLTESFITELSKIKGLKVISRSAAFTFKGRDVDPREVGRKLGVAAVLEGSVRRSGESVRVEVRLVSAADGRVLWASDNYDHTFNDIFKIQDGIACTVVAELKVRLCGEGEPFKRYTNDVEAYQAYLKGRYFINNQYQDIDKVGPEKTLLKAAGYFAQAIRIDPNYAPAYAGLSDAYTGIVWFSPENPQPLIARAKAAALKAVRIDDTLAEAHTALATVYVHEWDFESAGREHERAIALAPGDAWAHDGYATYLMAVGRVDEMLAEINRAADLDPLNVYIIGDKGTSLYMSRRYDEAIAEFLKGGELLQGYATGGNIAQCYLGKGMHEEAIKLFQRANRETTIRGQLPATMTYLAVGYAMAGKREEALRLLERAKDVSKKQYVSKTFFVYVYAALGDKDHAFEMLESAFREHDSNLIGLKTHPWFDPLRSDPRFGNLLKLLGLTV
jgi:TolB-like protein/DNA-binding winged helix-turn-helix (wHTH) protein/tetratricopeptide (TPR) repeat protein